MRPEIKRRSDDSTASLMGRRNFLCLGGGVLAGLLCPTALAARHTRPERSLAFYNTHTGESLRAVYWADGEYIDSSLQEINTILRDHRADEIYPMDRGLLDLLYALQSEVDCHKPLHVISGYRSPATNAKLRTRSSGVARRSYHM